MEGLSVVLEKQKSCDAPQVITKTTMCIPSNSSNTKLSPFWRPLSPLFPRRKYVQLYFPSPPSPPPPPAAASAVVFLPPAFPPPPSLEHCFLCRKKLLSGKDIYMYKGEKFCSVDCRCRQIFMDEEETPNNHNCSWAAMKQTAPPSSPSPSRGNSRNRRGSRNRAGGFAY